MKYFSLCLIFYSSLASGQASEKNAYHVIYMASWTFDKGDLAPAQEYVALSLNGDKAIFQKHNTRKLDSIRVNREPTIDEVTTLKNIEPYAIEFNGNNLTYFHTIGDIEYQYEETLNHQWQLGKDTKSIKGYSCRNATVSYGGRTWTAWYTTAIPLKYGPYKFHGLPGLIIKITDSTGNYDFEIYSINKRETVKLTKFFHDKTKENSVKTDRETYNQIRIKWNGLSFSEMMQVVQSKNQQQLSISNNDAGAMDENTLRNRNRAKEIGFIERDHD